MSHFKLRKFFYFILIAGMIFIFTGCNDESIKVMFDEYEGRGGRIEDLKTVAVLNFANDEGFGGDMGEQVAQNMAEFGYMKVQDRKETLRILKEKGLPTSGVVNPHDASEIARALGVDAVIYGDSSTRFNSMIKYKAYNYYPYYSRYKRNRRYYYRPYNQVPYLNRNGRVQINVHFYDAIIGEEIGIIELKRSYDRNYDTYYDSIFNNTASYYFDSGKDLPMPSDREMILLISNRLLDQLVSGFTPYYIERVRALQEGIAGAQKAKDGDWKEARNIWVNDLKFMPNEWKIPNNLGIFYERLGNPARSVSYYRDALRLDPGNENLKLYIEEIEKVLAVRKFFEPVDLEQGQARYEVAQVRDNSRVYITAGVEDGARPGDVYLIARKKVELGSDLVTPIGIKYYPVCKVEADKVFEGICWGSITKSIPGKIPRDKDIAIRVKTGPELKAEPEDEKLPDSPPEDSEGIESVPMQNVNSEPEKPE
ncbi:MAG: tetratricopeptide repeat protein [Vulcanimicrobiota bacterium]